MNRPEILRQEMTSVGNRLIAAIAVETERSKRFRRAPKTKRNLERWTQSRRRVETLTGKYLHATVRYREAMAGVTVSADDMNFKPGWGICRGDLARHFGGTPRPARRKLSLAWQTV